jgi:hypothetical protein
LPFVFAINEEYGVISRVGISFHLDMSPRSVKALYYG